MSSPIERDERKTKALEKIVVSLDGIAFVLVVIWLTEIFGCAK